MEPFKLAGYRWVRTLLYLDFAESPALGPDDRIVLRGVRSELDTVSPLEDVVIEMTNCSVESERRMRARFLLGEDDNPVRQGMYQLFVSTPQGEHPIAVADGLVSPQPLSGKRSDTLLCSRVSSYYAVVPHVTDGELWCTVIAKGMPDAFGYDARDKLLKAGKAFARAAIDFAAVETFDVFRDRFPSKPNKVLFTSDSRSGLTGNMEPLYNRIEERGLSGQLDIVQSFRHEGDDGLRPRSIPSYLRLAYHLATSRVIFCDDYQPYLYHVAYPQKTRLVQLWHACGHFKTVGWGRNGTLDAIAPFTNNHRSYTDAIVASESDVPIYGEAFGIADSCVKPFGIPRHDWLLDSAWQQARKADFAEAFPQADGKKVIVFAPTFRGAGKKTAHYDYGKIDMSRLLEFCRNNGYFFIFKMHPFIERVPKLPPDSSDVFADGSSIREINDLLPSTDVLVTDYSSVVYEAALLGIPTLYFAYDLEDYIGERDFYEPFEEFVSGKIVRTLPELLDAIESGDFEEERLAEFRKKNFKYLDGGACDRIIDEILLPAVRA